MRVSWFASLLALGCDRGGPVVVDAPAGLPEPAIAVVTPAQAEPVEAERAPSMRPIVLVRDPAELARIEAAGWTFARTAFAHEGTTNAELADDARWRSIVDVLARDVAEVAAGDPRAGVGLRFTHRLFDVGWLRSERAWFELVGVVNRLDRRAFHPGTCGETRLIYRLAHRAVQARQDIRSRLPMTVNVVLWQADDGHGCRDVASRWMVPDGADPVARLLADDGPLAAARRDPGALKSIEVDVQTSRWPGTIRPDLGGHASYVLRVFHRDPARPRMIEAPLENTPDVAKIRASKLANEELMEWIRDPATLEALDRGTARLPDALSARVSVSMTPRGLARLGNRPFTQLVPARLLADLPLAERDVVRSPAALLRRLDALSCAGCHGSRSLAGFHLVGDEPLDPDRVDALHVGASPHLLGDLPRRVAYVAAVAEGRTADERRGLPDLDAMPGGYGSHCGLGDPGFAAMTCADGLTCTAIDDAELGTCLGDAAGAGDPCELGAMIASADPRKDRIRTTETRTCERGGVCNGSDVGFPAGMCAVGCSATIDGEGCGVIVQLAAFNNCLAARRPFADCVRTSAGPAGMRACDEGHACRDDYVCARVGEAGVCMPPYFLYQLRVDGHPG